MAGKIDKIIDSLFIGNHYAALDQEVIDTHNIRTIINCTDKDERINMNINYLQIPLNDPPSEKDIQYLNKMFYPSVLFIDNSIKNGNNVLVHCKIGSQRAATIVAMYLMVKYNTTSQEAINFIKNIRPICFFDEFGYIESLKFVENKLNALNGGKTSTLSSLYDVNQDNKQRRANMNPFAFRKYIYDENKHLCTEGQFKDVKSHPSELVTFNNNLLPIPLYEDATIQVMDMDCLEMAKMMIDNKFKPLVLNVGNANSPCGNNFCQNNLLDAQEELLFCRTNFFKTLTVNADFYPLNSFVAIYSPQVFIFRNQELDFVKEPYYVSFVTASPIMKPVLMNGRMDENHYNLTFGKIDTIFQIGMSKGFDSLILTAFGCGIHGNPPYQIVEIFNRCIQRWKNSFKVIVFAIPSYERMYGKNSNVNGVCNYQFFKKYITI